MLSLDVLPIDIIKKITEFHSYELIIYLFPKTKINMPVYDLYIWASLIEHIKVRCRVFCWLINNGYVPINSIVLEFFCKKGNLVFIQKIFSIIEESSVKYIHRYSYVDILSGRGYIHILDWWYSNKLPFYFSEISMDRASEHNLLHILNWWLSKHINDGILLRYSKNAVDYTNSIDVLNWWWETCHKYDLKFKYSSKSIDNTTDPKILNWWLNKYLEKDLKIKYKHAINRSSERGDLHLLKWWFGRIKIRNFVTLKYDETTMNGASANGHLHVLEWWLEQWEKYRTHIFYTQDAIDLASENGHIKVLDWWLHMYIKGRVLFKRTVHAMNSVLKPPHIVVLDWWVKVHKTHKIPLLYDSNIFQESMKSICLNNWWFEVNTKHKLFSEIYPIFI